LAEPSYEGRRPDPLATASLVALLIAVVWEAVGLARGRDFLRPRELLDPSSVLLLIALTTAAAALVRVRRSSDARQLPATANLGMAGALLAGTALFLLAPLAAKGRAQFRLMECLANASVLASALAMYATDWEAYPPADALHDAVQEYVGDWTFVCPEAPDAEPGYAFNRSLAGVRPEEVKLDPNTVIIFESEAGPGAAGGPELLPARPHHGGADVYGFTGAYYGGSHFTRSAAASRSSIADGTTTIFWEPAADD
jgi:hypothetical protein